MASHGVPRPSGEAKTERAKLKELQDIEKYRTLIQSLDHAVEHEDTPRQTLDLTSKLLTWNPEYYTVWNHRRRILQQLLRPPTAMHAAPDDASASDTAEALIVADLDFLLPLLIKHPKCYWIWNHRRWLLQQPSVYCSPSTSKRLWQLEFGLVGKMLTRDSRNFHGWTYRRVVVGEMRKYEAVSVENDSSAEGKVQASAMQGAGSSLTEQEFDYTTKMLRSNLSNFSAWHNRSKLIPRLLEERQSGQAARREMFDAELAKVEDALIIDPYDQSLWFYHQHLITIMVLRQDGWLKGLSEAERREYIRSDIETFEELLEEFDDCKWILLKLVELSMLLSDADGEPQPIAREKVEVWLERLQTLDPLRKGRWDDLARKLKQ